ncbi:MAG: FecR family protein [Desulfobacterales bacterium]|nr:FecR family protein [Desulfobacterales bacterium]
MKKFFMIGLSLGVGFFCVPSYADMQPEAIGTMSFILGEASVSFDGKKWEPLHLDDKVFPGGRIRTGPESRCEITLNDGSVLRMDENSIQKLELEKEKKAKALQKFSIFLAAGKVWVNARKIVSKNKTFQVHTDKAVCAIRGTTFRVDETSDRTRVSVHEGQVAAWSSRPGQPEAAPGKQPSISKPRPVTGPHSVSMEKWVEIINELQQITIDSRGGYEKKDLDVQGFSKDPWVLWNLRREKLLRDRENISGKK